jgi:hypothetical protein
VGHDFRDGDRRYSIVDVGPKTVLSVFELDGNTEAQRQIPMFGRGRLDHLGLQAVSMEVFGEIRRRLLARGACDEFVTDFAPSSACSSVTRTGWRPKCAYPTRTPSLACSTRPAHPQPGSRPRSADDGYALDPALELVGWPAGFFDQLEVGAGRGLRGFFGEPDHPPAARPNGERRRPSARHTPIRCTQGKLRTARLGRLHRRTHDPAGPTTTARSRAPTTRPDQT